MTIITPFTVVNGAKTSNTMCAVREPAPVAYRRRRGSAQQRETAEAARRALSVLSRRLKAERDARVATAEMAAEAVALERLRVNDLLIEHYARQSGATAFHTFRQWQEQGLTVRKGETAFRVWGTPF